jgi:GT2 family glycosyltransferase
MLGRRWRSLFQTRAGDRAVTAAQPTPDHDLDFTIIICTCNRPDMWPRALASALHQTHNRYEIVVVDDSSHHPVVVGNPTERSVRVMRSPQRLGFAGAINLGARHANGRRIALLDDDDEYEPDLLSRTHARIQAQPDRQFSWCSTVFVQYDGSGKPVREAIRGFPEDYETEEDLLLTTVSIGSGYGFTVSRQLFQELGGFDHQRYWAIADTEFMYRLIAAGHRPAIVSEPLMRVHKHDGPRMTDRRSYRNRARQCELLRTSYAGLIHQYPRLGAAIDKSIEQLTALAVAVESEEVRK